VLRYGLAITMITLSVPGMAFTAVAAPYTPKSSQCQAPAQRIALLNILASDPMRAELASHITISAKRIVGLSATGSTHHRQAAALAGETSM
jgi:hypothetical protein